MKNTLFGLLIGLLGLGFWFFLQPSDQRGGGLENDGQPGVQGGESVLETGATDEEERKVFRGESKDESQVVLGSVSAIEDRDLCKIMGLVLDEKEQPVVGAQLMLAGSAPWEGSAQVDFPTEDSADVGWHGETDEEGRFEWNVPVPPRGLASLWIHAGEMHSELVIHFGGSYRLSREPLQVGSVNLGTLRLSPAGVVEGYVFDTNREPIEGAQLRLEAQVYWLDTAPVTTDAQGHYRLGSLLPGATSLKATHATHITKVRQLVEIKPNRVKRLDDFILSASPTLSGRILDPNDEPIEGVDLTSWSDGYGEDGTARTNAEGEFRLSLPRVEPYALSFEKRGYRPDPNQEGLSQFYKPGATGIELRMLKDPVLSVQVTDAVTGEPIEVFGVKVGYGLGPLGGKKVSSMGLVVHGLSHYPGGIAEVGATPGFDLFSVRAPGYSGSYENEILIDVGTENTQSIALERGPSFEGTITSGGMPVASAFVSIAPIELFHDLDAEENEEPEITNLRVDGYRTIRTKTDADGHFLFGGVSRTGSYRLAARSSSGSATRFPLKHSGKGVQDLGAIELGPGCTVTGEVLLPAGVASYGLIVRIDGNDQQHIYCDAQGKFEIQGLAEGMYRFRLEGTEGRLAEGIPVVAHVKQDIPQHIALDARKLGLCTVSVQVQAGGLDCSGIGVSFLPSDPADQMDPDPSLELCGLDVSGAGAGVVRACGDAHPVLQLIGLGWMIHPMTVHLEVGGAIDLVVPLTIAKLQLELPDAIALPEQARLYVRVSDYFQRFTLKGGQWSNESPWTGIQGMRTFTLSIPETGEVNFTYRLVDPTVEAVRVVHGEGFAMRTPRIVEGARSITLVEGETTTIVLE